MNILNKLTIKNLKLNKKRTIVTIIGILLSTALICAVAGMVSSFQKTLINDAIETNGNQHITIEEVKASDLDYFINNRLVEQYYLAENLGYAVLNGSQNESKPYLFIKSYTKNGLEEAKFHLTSGRLPENESEIILSESVISNALVKYRLGDVITLDVGTRTLLEDNSTLNQSNPYEEEALETITNTSSKTYTIVGFIERPAHWYENYFAPGYSAITYMSAISNEFSVDLSILFNKPKEYLDFQKVLDTEFNYNYTYNSDLLRWQMASDSSAMNVLITVAGVVMIIIILTSAFVIRNSFNISITEKTKQYGMLASVGATSKQIKKNVLFEGFILGLIGIPLGILCGIFADYVLIIIIRYLLRGMINAEFIFSVPLLAILISVALAVLCIFLSTISAARKSAKISPIDAIRSNNDIKISNKKLKTPKIIKKLFKTGGVVAYKNLKRSKKKYRTTVISLVVSVATFISLSSFISYGFSLSSDYYTKIDYNFSFGTNNNYGRQSEENLEKIYNDILNLEKIESYNIIYYGDSLNIDPNKYIIGDLLTRFENYFIHVDEFGVKHNIAGISIFAMEDSQYNNYVKKLKGNVRDFEDKAILVNSTSLYDPNTEFSYEGPLYNIKEGEIITGTMESTDGVVNNIDLEIARVTTEKPYGLESRSTTEGMIILSKSMLSSISECRTDYLILQVEDDVTFEQKVETYFSENPDNEVTYDNIAKYAREQNSMVLLISIFLYGFIIVISLIGITNIFNTITTNMNLRQKEFAMLKSIGMTKKEFNRMVRLETIFYGTKSLIIGTILGIIGSFFISKAYDATVYIIPWLAIAISIVAVFLLVSLIMHYSMKKINKQNIIETIRKENI